MKIAITDYEDCPYLTAGKAYRVEKCYRIESETSGWIRDDDDEQRYINFPKSAHIDGRAWIIVEVA